MLYHEFINSLRDHLDTRIDFRPGTKATAFEQCPNSIEVVTDKGSRIMIVRLAILATGDSRQLLEPLGGTQEAQAPNNAFAVAFDMEGDLRDPSGSVDW